MSPEGQHEDEAREAIEAVFREEYGSILASLIRRSGGVFEPAEEALSEALAAALKRWPSEGRPERPAAWIHSVARRRLIDEQRRQRHRDDLVVILEGEARGAQDEEEGVQLEGEFPGGDDRLRLIFTCCHPALGHDAQVALTLNTLGGLRSSEIAHAYLTREVTMSQRLVRAKRKIRDAGIPYRVPPAGELASRLPAVLDVLYLVFSAGYSAPSGAELVRRDLCEEALRLARVLCELMPAEPEVRGLLALMLLQGSRRLARVSLEGELVLLEDQDRSLWDREAIREGCAAVELALSFRQPGPYQVQAAIAAVHGEAMNDEPTDWKQIELLYDTLLTMTDSPVVRLNRAVAVAMSRGPQAGLEEIESLAGEGSLQDYHYLHAARADFLRRLGRDQEAREAYLRAMELADNAAERRFLSSRLAELP
jgi:RNA polymerase sigma-70 factor, ECF subfamily